MSAKLLAPFSNIIIYVFDLVVVIKEANTESEKKAADSFDLANKVEQIHHGLYRDALSRLESGETMELKPFYVCQYCGNTVEGEAPDKCPVCGAPKKMFKLIE